MVSSVAVRGLHDKLVITASETIADTGLASHPTTKFYIGGN